MKTWEMLKELTENPKKRFKRKNWEGVYICSKNGFICDSNGDRYGIYDVMEDLDGGWEELPREVTWQEALEAWANGKTVKCAARGYDNIYQKYDVVDDCDDPFLLDEVGNPLDAYEILEGKWYILEGKE
jgi:hypothetical protein